MKYIKYSVLKLLSFLRRCSLLTKSSMSAVLFWVFPSLRVIRMRTVNTVPKLAFFFPIFHIMSVWIPTPFWICHVMIIASMPIFVLFPIISVITTLIPRVTWSLIIVSWSFVIVTWPLVPAPSVGSRMFFVVVSIRRTRNGTPASFSSKNNNNSLALLR